MRRLLGIVLRAVVVLIFIVFTYFATQYLMKTKPKASQKKVDHKIFVKTQTFSAADYQTEIEGMGTVIPSQKLDMYSKIGGEIIYISPTFSLGSIVKKGTLLIKIEQEQEKRNEEQALITLQSSKHKYVQVEKDIIVTERRIQTELKRAKSILKSLGAKLDESRAKWQRVSQFKNVTSQEEYDIAKSRFNQDTGEFENAQVRLEELEIELTSLDIKKQELLLMEQQVKYNEIELANARQRLMDTEIFVPFDAVITQKNITTGSRINTNTILGTIVAIQEYWIEVAIPVSKLSWFSIPKTEQNVASTAKIKEDLERKDFLTGTVKQLLPSLDPEGRMAKIIISVHDPLGVKEKKPYILLLNSLVKVSIAGKKINSTIRIPRQYISLPGSAWVYNDNNTIEKKILNVIWKDNHNIYVQNDNNTLKVVVSDVPGALDGLIVEEIIVP